MIMGRRLFLLGTTATYLDVFNKMAIGVVGMAQTPTGGDTEPYRRLHDLIFSSSPDLGDYDIRSERAVQFNLLRGKKCVLSCQINWRATFRWVIDPNNPRVDLVFDNEPMVLEVKNACANTVVSTISQVKRGGQLVGLSETYTWHDERLVEHNTAYLEPLKEN